MTTYRLEITRDAVRALAKLDKPIRRRIQTAVDGLRHDPRPHGTAALRGASDLYRIRVGDYRVVYTVQDERLLVLVVDLGHRREVYRGL